MASEAIVVCLLLSWRDFFHQIMCLMIMTVKYSTWPAKNVIFLLLSWRNYWDRTVMASEAIVICLLLSWRDSFSKLSV